MSDTMIAMDLIHADNLSPSQLMLGDLIKIDNDIVEVIFIESDSTGDNYDIQTENEFGEREVTQYSYTDEIPLYVFIEEEEQLSLFLCTSPHKNGRPAVGRVCAQPVDNYSLLTSNPNKISLRQFIFFSPILGKIFCDFYHTIKI